MESAVTSVSERLARLEQQNRQLKIGFILVLLVVSAVGVMGQAGMGRQRVVEAERFVLLDAKGEERGYFAVDESNDAKLALFANKKFELAPVSWTLQIARKCGRSVPWPSASGERSRTSSRQRRCG